MNNLKPLFFSFIHINKLYVDKINNSQSIFKNLSQSYNNLILLNTYDIDGKQTETLNLITKQLNDYKLEYLNNIETINKLYLDKKTLLHNLYNSQYSIKAQFETITDLKRNKVYFAYEKDLSEYKFIDKRFNIGRALNINHLVYKLYLSGKISKNQYRRFKRHNIISDDIQSRINVYLTTTLNKIGHKKQYKYLRDVRKDTDNIIYIDYLKHNIKLKNVKNSDLFYLNDISISKEINLKISNEIKVYAYSKV